MKVLGTLLTLGLFSLISMATTAVSIGATSQHNIIVGLATTVACETQGWHDSGHPGWSALDLRANDCGNAGSTDVYWQSYHSVGTEPMLNTPVTHDGVCTGMDVKPNDYGYLGDYTYTHVQVSSWGSWYAYANNGWTIRYVGSVLLDENTNCKPTYWSGPHLHQGGNTGSPPVYRNWGLLSGPGTIISPTGDWANNYEHKYVW